MGVGGTVGKPGVIGLELRLSILAFDTAEFIKPLPLTLPCSGFEFSLSYLSLLWISGLVLSWEMSEACLAMLILVLVDSPVFDLEIEDEVVTSLTAPNLGVEVRGDDLWNPFWFWLLCGGSICIGTIRGPLCGLDSLVELVSEKNNEAEASEAA